MKWVYGLGVIGILIVVFTAVYFLAENRQINKPQPTSGINQSEIVQVNSKLSKFVDNNFGFEIEFPPTSSTYMASCEDFKNGTNGNLPVTAIVDEKQNAVYITNTNTVEVMNKAMGGGDFGYDFDKCKEVDTSLKLLKSGYPNGLPKEMGNRSYPLFIKFSYGKS